MSWAGLASNQCISYYNLQDAVATGVFMMADSSIPPGNKQITRNEAEAFVVINPITSKALNQLPVKSDLTPITGVYKWELSSNGDTSSLTACSLFLDIYTIAWTNTATPVAGTVFYEDYTLTTIFPMSGYTGFFLHFRPWNTTGAGFRARFRLDTSTINSLVTAC
jgi:hypothetical protein